MAESGLPDARPSIVRLDRAVPQPWRNGGGCTRELLAWPAADDWQVRVSVADIDQAGPFSSFPGVDRWFVVIEGNGIALRFGDRIERLTPDSEPLHFDGAQTPDCEPIDGPTRDLNFMVRRRAGQASIKRAVVGCDWVDPAPLRVVFTLGPLRLQLDDGEFVAVPAAALAWHSDAAHQTWRLILDEVAAPAWLLTFAASP